MTDSPLLSQNVELVKSFDLTLLSNFVHQVVNPLNGIAGTLDNLIEDRIEGAHRREQRLRASRAQLEQCISLVRNLAYFAQGFSALDKAEFRTVVIPQVIIEAAMFFQEDAANKDLRIELEDRHSQNKIYGHPNLVRQVFMNLFDNAVKYSENGTIIRVNQKVQRKSGDILVTIQNKSKYPLDVADVPRLFDLGVRGQNAQKIVASGTGLGLNICRKIVEDVHGGKLWLDSARSGDITFFLRLGAVE